MKCQLGFLRIMAAILLSVPLSANAMGGALGSAEFFIVALVLIVVVIVVTMRLTHSLAKKHGRKWYWAIWLILFLWGLYTFLFGNW